MISGAEEPPLDSITEISDVVTIAGCERFMNRKYITGWFSPNDPDLMVMFYQVDKGSPAEYQADVLKRGGVVQTYRDSNLGRLQSDVTDRCGGDPRHVHPLNPPKQARALPSDRSWLGYLRRPRALARAESKA